MNLLDLIKQRRAVCDAATAGPWTLKPAQGQEWPRVLVPTGEHIYPRSKHNARTVARPDEVTFAGIKVVAECNAAFIAASRNERPSELDALAIAIEALQDADAILRRKGATDLQLRMEAAVVVDEALAQIRAKLENTDAKS